MHTCMHTCTHTHTGYTHTHTHTHTGDTHALTHTHLNNEGLFLSLDRLLLTASGMSWTDSLKKNGTMLSYCFLHILCLSRYQTNTVTGCV